MDVCVVTGTSTGIGRAAALHFARNGFRVAAAMRDPGKAAPLEEAAAAEGLPLRVQALDVTDAGSIAAAVAEIVETEGRVDVLVNNAGLSNSPSRPLTNARSWTWRPDFRSHERRCSPPRPSPRTRWKMVADGTSSGSGSTP